jgi:RNA polymerase sigma-B factor
MAFSDSTDPAHLRPSFAERDAETTELFRRLSVASEHEAEHLVEEITLLYLDLCTRMAARYDGRGIEHDDLVQVARLALLKAIQRYEPGRGRSFAAYAVPTMSGELKRHFRDRGWMVRPPRRVQELRHDVSARRADLEQQLGRGASDREIADALGLAVQDVRELAWAASCYRPVSIDPPLPGGEAHEPTAGLGYEDPAFELVEDRVCLAEGLADLDPRSRTLLALRFVDGLTQREIGEALGMTQMQVCRALGRVLRRLREAFCSEGLDRSA